MFIVDLRDLAPVIMRPEAVAKIIHFTRIAFCLI